MKKTPSVTPSSGNVFADLGLPDAEELKLKADLAVFISRKLNDLNLTQAAAALKLGMHQPEISNIVRGKLDGFKVARLLDIIAALGNDVEIKIKPVRNHKPGRVLMRA